MSEIRLLIADDNPLIRDITIRDLTLSGIFKIIACTESSDETLKTAEKLLPDIALLDTHMPGLLSCLELTRRLSRLRRIKAVMLSGSSKLAGVRDFLDAGAAAFLLKSDAPAVIRMSLLMVSRGSRGVMSPDIPRQLVQLQDEDRLILQHVSQAKRLPQAAARIGVTETDLRQVLNELAAKLDLSDVSHVVKWARQNGF